MKVTEVIKFLTGEESINDPSAQVRALRTRIGFTEYPLKSILAEIDINKHDVMNPSIRKNKDIYRETKKKRGPTAPGAQPASETVQEFVKTVQANRIPIGLQKMICDKRTSFCLANPVIREYSGFRTNEAAEAAAVQYALDKILFDNKITTNDREVGRNIFTYTEVAEFWYTDELKEAVERYGFNSKIKLKFSLFTRLNSKRFFPISDESGDFICFSREYEAQYGGSKKTCFDVYTSDEIYKYRRINTSIEWTLVETITHSLGKMPIVFGWQAAPEYEVIKTLNARLEVLLSNHGEINDYHSAPKMVLTDVQSIEGGPEKGDTNTVIQIKGKDGKVEYLTWEHSTDSVKLEIDNLLSLIFMLTQTPNISFDNLKGLGAVSGVAIKLMFMDAHLAVKDKEGVLGDYFQRRNSIILAFLQKMDPTMKPMIDKIEINNVLSPYMIADDKEEAEIVQIKNGNKAVISQETSVIQSGGDKDEFTRLKAQEGAAALTSITEPTF